MPASISNTDALLEAPWSACSKRDSLRTSGLHRRCLARGNEPRGAAKKGACSMMAAIIRQVPGLIGAIAAYAVLRILRWLFGIQSIAGELLILVVIVLVVALIAERAMRKYQQ